MKGLQLPLGVQLAETASFATFYPGPNVQAVAAARAMAAAAAPPLLLVFGPAGSGKSHLLQAVTREAAAGQACAYVPLRQMHQDRVAAADALEGLEQADLACLDDIDAVLADPAWAVALVRLLDGLRTHGGRGLLAAAAPPERLACALPDLRTRLSAAAIYGLKPLSDDDRLELLAERARGRGLDLPAEAARYLLARLPRDAGSLLSALDRLDWALLSAQRRLTLPFIQQWLKDSAAGNR